MVVLTEMSGFNVKQIKSSALSIHQSIEIHDKSVQTFTRWETYEILFFKDRAFHDLEMIPLLSLWGRVFSWDDFLRLDQVFLEHFVYLLKFFASHSMVVQ